MSTGDSPQDTETQRVSGSLVTGFQVSSSSEALTVDFLDTTFTFHAQWLHDAQVDAGPSKDAIDVFTQKGAVARIRNTKLSGQELRSSLDVTWDDGSTSCFPTIWLRAFAPLVAKPHDSEQKTPFEASRGWLPTTLKILEFSYKDIFPKDPYSDTSNATKEQIYDAILKKSSAGIVKVIDLPEPNLEDERQKENTFVMRVLKQLFGSVFLHPIRGTEKTFNISSHHEEDAKRGANLPNYNAIKALLPHADHAHYIHPSRVQGLYALEGESQNTFVSCYAALETLNSEAPELVKYLKSVPMVIGRVADFYDPPLYQATVDTAITMEPGMPDHVKRFRWHPHLAGSLLSPYDTFAEARTAYRAFQEIMRRDTHQLNVLFKPGDLYIWDNFRILHGRERILTTPRTVVGQTVPEQVVDDAYRVLKMRRLKGFMDEKWLVHTPLQQLEEMVRLAET
ncbi:Clavaminate synthase-like protein [Mollisia scopiformis]|uniref:Clavaminate synthase-like protein n=1 Tax=Mollisia scopiformis TaxID=149040 RepID=A0A194XA76_MOLSC|nr:Clavaminate synthase-like protein [Mollisia scopiformis]KUJ16667.1 Clavaminate synthase-like protein [Mollisia scopiformis]